MAPAIATPVATTATPAAVGTPPRLHSGGGPVWAPAATPTAVTRRGATAASARRRSPAGTPPPPAAMGPPTAAAAMAATKRWSTPVAVVGWARA